MSIIYEDTTRNPSLEVFFIPSPRDCLIYIQVLVANTIGTQVRMVGKGIGIVRCGEVPGSNSTKQLFSAKKGSCK